MIIIIIIYNSLFDSSVILAATPEPKMVRLGPDNPPCVHERLKKIQSIHLLQ